MELYQDLENIILDKFKKLGIEVEYSNIHKLLLKYFNIKSKTVPQINWNVFCSSEIKSKTLPESYYASLKKVKKKFETGRDINPYLSYKSFNPDSNDLLLYEWKIYHLHLIIPGKSRSKYLLFFFIENNNVYFIDVLPHSKKSSPESPNLVWVEKNLLKIIKDNWPNIIDYARVSGSIDDVSDEDRFKLRKAGIGTSVEIDGTVYMPPGGGITSARSALTHTIWANRLLNRIRQFKEDVESNPDKYKSILKKNGFNPPQKLDFKLIEKNGKLLYLETNLNVTFESGFNI